MNLFPLFVKLDGRRVIVVGGGEVATSKINGLLQAGALSHVHEFGGSRNKLQNFRANERIEQHNVRLLQDVRGLARKQFGIARSGSD